MNNSPLAPLPAPFKITLHNLMLRGPIACTKLYNVMKGYDRAGGHYDSAQNYLREAGWVYDIGYDCWRPVAPPDSRDPELSWGVFWTLTFLLLAVVVIATWEIIRHGT